MREYQRVLTFFSMIVNYTSVWAIYTIPLLYLSLAGKSYGMSDFHIGVVFSMFSAGALFSTLLFMVFKIREKTNIYYLISFTSAFLVMSCYLMGYSIKLRDKVAFSILTGACRFFQGYAHATIFTVNYSSGMLLFPGHIQTVLALFNQSSAVGYAIGPYLGVIFYQNFGGYYGMYSLISLQILLTNAFQIICFVKFDFKKQIRDQESCQDIRDKMENRKIKVDRNIVITTILYMNVYLQLVIPSSYHSVYLKTYLNQSEKQIATLQIVYAFGCLIAPIFLYGQTTSLQRKWVILVTTFFSGVAMFFFIRQDQLGMPWTDQYMKLGFYLQGTCHVLLCCVYQLEVISLFAKLGLKGSRITEFVTCIAILAVNIGEMIGPPLGGLLFDRYEFEKGMNIFLAATIPTLILMYICLVDWKDKQQPTADSEEQQDTYIQMN